MPDYQYTESGLQNVWLRNMPSLDPDVACMVKVRRLHYLIAIEIVLSGVGLSGHQLRFLRTEMEKTRGELRTLLHTDAMTFAFWEDCCEPIPENAQTVIRLLAIEVLDLPRQRTVTMAASSIATSQLPPIIIDIADPQDYQVIAGPIDL